MIRLFTVSMLFLVGCGSPTHLQYDHGRASTAAYSTQANLGRPVGQADGYMISGEAGLEIRTRVFERATDAETGKAQYVQVIGVE